MAQTISHEAKAPVKTNPGAPATGKEALLRLLERTGDIVADLHEDFLDVYEMLEPEPRPLPETVNPNVLFTQVVLKSERDAVYQAGNALGAEVEAFKQAVKRMRGRMVHGRNSKAWSIILEKLEKETHYHLEALHSSIGALMSHVSVLAALVTFAEAEDVPDAFKQEAGNE